ncbi:hypothetical protein H5410_007648 [Solanum commersonii]|uniref:Uncharacterized protein n=1 Tax=Solanum commersonii TaxID=4109 RepID=A0A9J6ACM0_SOLCO|nr:hypothetical protein H5410_007648 [Solanum commersonii]
MRIELASLFELAKQLDLQELNGGDLNNGGFLISDERDAFIGSSSTKKVILYGVIPSLEVAPPRKSEK